MKITAKSDGGYVQLTFKDGIVAHTVSMDKDEWDELAAVVRLHSAERRGVLAVAGTMRGMHREAVYKAVDSERNYQERGLGNANKQSLSVGESLLCMEHCLATARSQWYLGASGPSLALDHVRKLTALGVACMETHGAPHRVLPLAIGGLGLGDATAVREKEYFAAQMMRQQGQQCAQQNSARTDEQRQQDRSF